MGAPLLADYFGILWAALVGQFRFGCNTLGQQSSGVSTDLYFLTGRDGVYEKGVKIRGSEKRDLEHRLERSVDLNFWDIEIHPKTVLL